MDDNSFKKPGKAKEKQAETEPEILRFKLFAKVIYY
jgi:hypothetical protein